MKNIHIFILVLTLLVCPLNLWAQSETTFLQFNGSYKNLLVGSKSLYTNERFFIDTQRLRLDFKKDLDPWQFFLSLDNELLINDFSNTADFDFIRSKTQEKNTAWDMDKTSVDNDHIYLRHAVYRAHVKYYSDTFQATLGKQGIDWGKMRFYSPLDIFNTVGPIDLERDQRIGIDAINLNFTPTFLDALTFVYAPGRENDEDQKVGAKISQKVGTYDLSLVAASIRKDELIGASFDGYLQDAGFRGEFSQHWYDDQRHFMRIALGVDYNFNENLYVLFEQFYNGGNEIGNPLNFLSNYQRSSKVLSLNKNLSNIWVKYRLNPLLHLNTYLIYDWDEESTAINPEVVYNVTQNAEISGGVQLFSGETDSEFGDSDYVVYAQLKWFF